MNNLVGFTVKKNKAFGWKGFDDSRFATWVIERGYPVAEIYDGSECKYVGFKEPIACMRPKGWKLPLTETNE